MRSLVAVSANDGTGRPRASRRTGTGTMSPRVVGGRPAWCAVYAGPPPGARLVADGQPGTAPSRTPSAPPRPPRARDARTDRAAAGAAAASRADAFDDLVRDAADRLERRWPQLADVEFAVQEVPWPQDG